jgi:hypothetical protein
LDIYEHFDGLPLLACERNPGQPLYRLEGFVSVHCATSAAIFSTDGLSEPGLSIARLAIEVILVGEMRKYNDHEQHRDQETRQECSEAPTHVSLP